MISLAITVAVAIRRAAKKELLDCPCAIMAHDEALYYMFMDDMVNGFARQYTSTNGKVACNMIREP